MVTLDDLIVALDDVDAPTTTTSVRQPTSLRTALQIGIELGLAPNANDATNQALRALLDAFAQRLALDEHYAQHPGSRPTLAEVARALAVLDRSPLVDRVDLLEQAEREVRAYKAVPDGEEVLLWATSLLVGEGRATA